MTQSIELYNVPAKSIQEKIECYMKLFNIPDRKYVRADIRDFEEMQFDAENQKLTRFIRPGLWRHCSVEGETVSIRIHSVFVALHIDPEMEVDLRLNVTGEYVIFKEAK